MDWAKAKVVLASLGRTDSAAAEMAFYLSISLVPLVGISIAVVGLFLPVDLSASIAEVLRGVLPTESRVNAGEVLRWAHSTTSQGWLTFGFLLALWTSFRFMSLCVRTLGATVASAGGPAPRAWHSTNQSLLLLAVWIAALAATALFLVVAPAIEHGLVRLHRLAVSSLVAFAVLRALLVAGVLFGAIFLTFRVVVGTRVGRLRVAAAAALASLGWIGTSLGFSLAVPVLWGATQLYGALGSVVLFLIWAYVIAWILLLAGLLLVPTDRVPAAA
jgi:membrane protein